MDQIFDRSSNALARMNQVRVCQWMVFAKACGLFWFVEPNFRPASRNPLVQTTDPHPTTILEP